MTRRFVFVALLAAALALPALAGAQPANFSGKWIQDMEKSDPMGGGRGPAGPQTVTITQTATELTLERETPNGVMKTVYKLDGSPSVNPGGRGGEITSTSAWEGSKLVTKYTRTMGQNSMEVVETRSLEADGTLLLVTAMKGGPMGDTTRKTVFKKS
ncbi:MAG TPA: hypothetical protein PLN93_07440 [Vicinamibacterales bacterium]|nr:hypothetical protein [Vicinamibacterales bacterium]HOQ60569.1 hypothetical protein [Vicinamibacterales bacterium]HPK71759.1 hypothetical protein [Vicinamibacterales bacterium]